MDLFGTTRAMPAGWARAVVEDRTLDARRMASSIARDDRLDFARAVVFAVVSAYWKELRGRVRSTGSMRESPPDLGIPAIPDELGELAESIGVAAAGLDVLDAGYLIGVLYTGMMPAGFRAQLGGALHAARALRAATGHGDGGRCRLAIGASARPRLWRRGIPRAGGATHGTELPRVRRQGRPREHSAPVGRVRAGPVRGVDVGGVPRRDAR